jgi:hypothetical protein
MKIKQSKNKSQPENIRQYSALTGKGIVAGYPLPDWLSVFYELLNQGVNPRVKHVEKDRGGRWYIMFDYPRVLRNGRIAAEKIYIRNENNERQA